MTNTGIIPDTSRAVIRQAATGHKALRMLKRYTSSKD